VCKTITKLYLPVQVAMLIAIVGIVAILYKMYY